MGASGGSGSRPNSSSANKLPNTNVNPQVSGTFASAHLMGKSPRLASESDTHIMTITPSQSTISSRRDKVECKGDLIKTIVSDLYIKQSDILRLKQEMDAEYWVPESAGGPCYMTSSN